MRGKWVLVAGIAAFLVFGAIALYRVAANRSPARSGASLPAAGAESNGPALNLPGTVEAIEVVLVPAPFSGRIMTFHADVGSTVAEGDLLAEIRSTVLESERDGLNAEINRLRSRVGTLESNLMAARLDAAKAREAVATAQAQLNEAQKVLARQQLLLSKGAAARQAVDRAQAAFDSANEIYEERQKLLSAAEQRVADLSRELTEQQQLLTEKDKEYEEALAQLFLGDVRSPADGYIVARKGQVGDVVPEGMEDLFIIATDLTHLRVVVDAPPELTGGVQVGQPASLQVAELQESLSGKVTEVAGGRIVIEFENPTPVVKPGMKVQAVIQKQ